MNFLLNGSLPGSNLSLIIPLFNLLMIQLSAINIYARYVIRCARVILVKARSLPWPRVVKSITLVVHHTMVSFSTMTPGPATLWFLRGLGTQLWRLSNGCYGTPLRQSNPVLFKDSRLIKSAPGSKTQIYPRRFRLMAHNSIPLSLMNYVTLLRVNFSGVLDPGYLTFFPTLTTCQTVTPLNPLRIYSFWSPPSLIW